MRELRRKLRSRRGVTLTELLATVLILSLVTAGAVTGVSASLRVYRRSVRLSDAQTLSSTLSIALMDELRYAKNPKGDTGTAVFTSAAYGADVSVGSREGRVVVGAVDGEGRVTDGRELIGGGAYAGLAADASVAYSDGVFSVTVRICSDDTADTIQEVSFSVRPLNG